MIKVKKPQKKYDHFVTLRSPLSFTNKRKAQGFSLQTIVVAVLVLMVMIVLIIIFSNKTAPVADLYSKCTNPEIGGEFAKTDVDCPDTKPYTHPLYKLKDENTGKVTDKCCVEKFV